MWTGCATAPKMKLGDPSRPPGFRFRPPKDCDACSLPPWRHRHEGHLSWDRAALQSVVRDDVPGSLGSPIPPRRHRFRIALAVFQPSPSAEHLRIRLILSCALPSLQSLSNLRRPGSHVRAPSLGLPPSSRHQPAESTHASIPSSLRSVLDVSHVLDGFLLHRPLRVCFTPQPRPGFALQGVSLARSRTSSSPAVALLPFARRSCQIFRLAPERRARLQGFAPLANPSQHAAG
jgi:hypothetical protein